MLTESERDTLYPQLRSNSITYLDHAGSTLYSSALVDRYSKLLQTSLAANPHSDGPISRETELAVNQCRHTILKHFDASPAEYSVIFTQNASGAAQIVADSLQFQPTTFWDYLDLALTLLATILFFPLVSMRDLFSSFFEPAFVYLADNHTSIVGIRNCVSGVGADFQCLANEQELERYLSQTPPSFRWLTSKLPRPQLFAYSAQSNFNGKRYPLSWIKRFQAKSNSHRRCLVLLDIASYASTSPFSFTEHPGDFGIVSFYKMFGFPTGVGALIARKDALSFMSKRYFGGGTVDALIASENWQIFSEKQWENGTLPFLEVLAVDLAFKQHVETFVSFHHISRHSTLMRQYALEQLGLLTHYNNAKVVHFYGDAGEGASFGPLLNFNLMDSAGYWIPCSDVQRAASFKGFVLRTGSFCNPGALQHHLNLLNSAVKARYYDQGRKCGDDYTNAEDGTPTGSIRISFAAITLVSDIDKFVQFLREFYVEDSPPTKYDESDVRCVRGFVTKLTIYPIKSCHGFSVDAGWPATVDGLLHDRVWQIVRTCDGKAIQQTNYPRMCLIRPVIDADRSLLVVSVDRYDSLEIPLELQLSQSAQADVDAWFSNVLEVECSLVKTAFSQSFANDSPYLIVNEASYRDVKCTVGHNANKIESFRPNIVVELGEAYVEDQSTAFKIGQMVFSSEMACKRCSMINVDQETAKINSHVYMKLAKQKRIPGKSGVYFGRHSSLISGNGEIIKVGDVVVAS